MIGVVVNKHGEPEKISGKYVTIEEEEFYKIENYDAMKPFFMSLVSDGDHWMFISGTGGLTAGRKNADHALFPYYVEDRVTENFTNTGSKTIILVTKNSELLLWEPFSPRYEGVYRTTRDLYKNIWGNKLIFEEINHDLGLVFRYSWMTSDRFGFVRRSELRNLGSKAVDIRLLDGIRNFLPSGVASLIQNEFSCLVDAYKKNELDPETGLGIFSLSSVLTDKAEPSEALTAATVWSAGIKADNYLITENQLDNFRMNMPLTSETGERGRRCAYFVEKQLAIPGAGGIHWFIAAERDQDHRGIISLQMKLAEPSTLVTQLIEDIRLGTENLIRIVSKADGLQLSEDKKTAVHHYANTLFNVMRGGVPEEGYSIDTADFLAFIKVRNLPLLEKVKEIAAPARINYFELEKKIKELGAGDVVRLFYEYLPLSFSRRHGDPSRPWNKFFIEIRDEKGGRIKNYQGNWRDIFQNWEALGFSYPGYFKGMIAKFLNAVTPDGYNPYRITREGIEWEEPEPENPWANIGYWGDHQVIYLLKLIEWLEKFSPGSIAGWAGEEIFSYADVPYRIKPYCEILQNNRDTILFDFDANEKIHKRVERTGSDGKLVHLSGGDIYLVNLTEKILILVLAKLANYVPGGGIWMNNQRPEWNDANNALAGPGLSMVTLYYLRRFLGFFIPLYKNGTPRDYSVSGEILSFFYNISDVLNNMTPRVNVDDKLRKKVMDSLGAAATQYRTSIYKHGFSGSREMVTGREIAAFFSTALMHLDVAIARNKREDGLYHAYNLLRITGDHSARIEPLYEMLEGQVAVLSSGYLDPSGVEELLTTLRGSALYRSDRNSYTLYPDKALPRFLDKNTFSPLDVAGLRSVRLFREREDRRILSVDEKGLLHFNGSFRNALFLEAALDGLVEEDVYKSIIPGEKKALLELYEKQFKHNSFTGRSGTFFAYEGLGSIYWHMVSKLLLAVHENYEHALRGGAPGDVLNSLAAHYYDIRGGLGFNKEASEYGAFPSDPYSHTPAHTGARQPGMTGQVKEEILTRWGELGVEIDRGRIRFAPALLRKTEFSTGNRKFKYYDVAGEYNELEINRNQLVFTYSQVPVVYTVNGEKSGMRIVYRDSVTECETPELPEKESLSVMHKEGAVVRIEVDILPESLFEN